MSATRYNQVLKTSKTLNGTTHLSGATSSEEVLNPDVEPINELQSQEMYNLLDDEGLDHAHDPTDFDEPNRAQTSNPRNSGAAHLQIPVDSRVLTWRVLRAYFTGGMTVRTVKGDRKGCDRNAPCCRVCWWGSNLQGSTLAGWRLASISRLLPLYCMELTCQRLQMAQCLLAKRASSSQTSSVCTMSSNKVILQLASAPVVQFECQQMVVNEPADSHTLQRHTKKRRIATRTVWSQNDAAPDFTPSAVGGTNMQWELTGKFSKLESNKVNFDTIDMHTAEEDMVSENAVFDDNLSSQAGSMGRQVGIFAIRNHPILCFYLQERLHSARNDAFSNIVHAMTTFANSATQLNTIIDNFLAVTRELTAEFEYNISTTPVLCVDLKPSTTSKIQNTMARTSHLTMSWRKEERI